MVVLQRGSSFALVSAIADLSSEIGRAISVDFSAFSEGAEPSFSGGGLR